MFYPIIFLYLLLVVSISKVQFSSLCRLFSVVHEHRLRSTQNAERIKRFLVIKPLIKKKNTINSLSCWSVTKFLCKCSACQKLEPAGRIGDFGNLLNECNFSWKIVKYCILYEACMIKTAPHSTLSPQTWCIKKYKRLVCTHPDLLARICKVNLSNANST